MSVDWTKISLGSIPDKGWVVIYVDTNKPDEMSLALEGIPEELKGRSMVLGNGIKIESIPADAKGVIVHGPEGAARKLADDITEHYKIKAIPADPETRIETTGE